jgi:Ring finger domain
VAIEAFHLDCDSSQTFLSYGDFSKLHLLLQELTHLLSLRSVKRDCDELFETPLQCHERADSESASLPTFDGQPVECTICWSNLEASVLPCCRHSLCSECETRWVRKKLVCPFCRTQFPNRRAVNRTTWELTTWDLQEELETEIQAIQKQIDSFWISFDEGKPSPVPLVREQSYIEVPRRIAMMDDADGTGLVIVHKNNADTTVPPYYVSPPVDLHNTRMDANV